MIEHISAPAPRLLLRLFIVQKILEDLKSNLKNTIQIAEIGAGLGDAASMVEASLNDCKLDLYEDSDIAHEALSVRFNGKENIDVSRAYTSSSACYDLMLCFEVVEHIENDQEFLTQLSTGLKPTGFLIGSVPAFMNKWQDVDVFAGHYRRYEREELIEKLELSGLKVIAVNSYGFPTINLLQPLRDWYFGKMVKTMDVEDKLASTRRSGVSRDFLLRFNKKLVYYPTYLLSLLQNIPHPESYDDGFIFLCQKK